MQGNEVVYLTCLRLAKVNYNFWTRGNTWSCVSVTFDLFTKTIYFGAIFGSNITVTITIEISIIHIYVISNPLLNIERLKSKYDLLEFSLDANFVCAKI